MYFHVTFKHMIHPHRSRHTVALQATSGHPSLDVIRRYLMIVQADLASAYDTASTVANWKL